MIATEPLKRSSDGDNNNNNSNHNRCHVPRNDTEIRNRLLQKLGIFFGGSSSGNNKSSDSWPAAPTTCSSSDTLSLSSGSISDDDTLSPLHSSQSSFMDDTSNMSFCGKMEARYLPTPPPPGVRKSTTSTSTVASSSSMGTTSVSPSIPACVHHQADSKYLSLLDYSTEHGESLHVREEMPLSSPNKTIRFAPQVDVVSIPSHREYPKRIRRKLWATFQDIQINGERNVLEFEADGRDWRTATEEDAFCLLDGELYHPATYESYRFQKSRYFAVKQQQQLKKKKQEKKKKNQPPPLWSSGRGLIANAMPSLTRFADT